MYKAVQKNPVLEKAENQAKEELYVTEMNVATVQEMMTGTRLQQEGILRNTAESLSSVPRKLVMNHRFKKKRYDDWPPASSDNFIYLKSKDINRLCHTKN